MLAIIIGIMRSSLVTKQQQQSHVIKMTVLDPKLMTRDMNRIHKYQSLKLNGLSPIGGILSCREAQMSNPGFITAFSDLHQAT